MSAEPPRTPHAVVGDRYELGMRIGRGGMADVYQAHDRMLERDVAVKLLRDVSGSDTDRARFAAEARVLAGLAHPNLVTVLDAAMDDDRPYLVMQLVRGPSLSQVSRDDVLDPERVRVIGAQIADALAYVHAQDVVHRDLKPGNILLAEDDVALLADFGIARLLSSAARHTATGTAIGTAAYLSPEQVRGEDVTPATDVWSLGLVLLETLTGERAYRGAPTEAALARLASAPDIPDTVPTAWRDLLASMTTIQPDERPDPRAVASTLRTLDVAPDSTRPLTAGATVSVDRPTADQHTAGRSMAAWRTNLRSHGRWIAVAGVAIIAVAVGVITGDDRGEARDLPDGVPQRLAQPLQDLHDAVEGQP
jgi:serine/threonine protein kinase